MSIPRMTRVREEIDEAISKYASERKWTISFAIAQILEDSPIHFFLNNPDVLAPHFYCYLKQLR
mgnify:CR=1 FL=1